MKKKIIIGLSIFSLIFLLAGIYIITTIETATAKLDNLIILHQVEILREHLLINIKRVQSDLNLKNTRYARSIDTVILNVRNMENMADKCFECHHSGDVLERLSDIRNDIDKYKGALSRVFTIRANISRLEAEEDNAFRTGENLILKVNNMISVASINLEKKTQSALGNIADTKTILYILLAAGPLLAAVIAFIFMRGFTGQVNVLLEATRSLEKGNLDYRIEGLRDEFGEVAASFNKMAASLKEQMYKMQRAEQMVVLGELAAGLAHEIKNPLTGIKLSIEILAEKIFTSEEDKVFMLKIINEIKRIDSLIKSLLKFARPPKPNLMDSDVNDILNETVTFSLKHPSLSSETSTSINVLKHFDNSLPEIMADPMQLQQVFLNLLLNAIDTMKDGGTLFVKTSYDAGKNAVQIEISDTGKGIDEKVIDKIFQPFFTTKPKGTGLGLAITKRLIEQHGGDISAENNPGGGATFKISLPVKKEEKNL